MRLFEDLGEKISDLFQRRDWSWESCVEVAKSLFNWQGCLAGALSLVVAAFVIGTFVDDWWDNVMYKLEIREHICTEHAHYEPDCCDGVSGKVKLYCSVCRGPAGNIEPESREEVDREYYLYEGESCRGFYSIREKWTFEHEGEAQNVDTVYYRIEDIYTHEYTITREGTLPSCFEGGFTDEITCIKCSEIVQPYMELPPAGHSLYVGVSYSATCEHGGYTGDVRCRGCDYFEEGTYTPESTEHAYRVWGDVQIEQGTGRKFKMMICDWCQQNHREYLN